MARYEIAVYDKSDVIVESTGRGTYSITIAKGAEPSIISVEDTDKGKAEGEFNDGNAAKDGGYGYASPDNQNFSGEIGGVKFDNATINPENEFSLSNGETAYDLYEGNGSGKLGYAFSFKPEPGVSYKYDRSDTDTTPNIDPKILYSGEEESSEAGKSKASGVSGASKASEPSGSSGPSGASGASGGSNASGSSGTSGASSSGASGGSKSSTPSGASGSSGPSGGSSGASGGSNASGSSGASSSGPSGGGSGPSGGGSGPSGGGSGPSGGGSGPSGGGSGPSGGGSGPSGGGSGPSGGGSGPSGGGSGPSGGGSGPSGPNPPCFTRGTYMRTQHGEVLIEDLVIGDRLWTEAHGYQPVRWICNRSIAAKGEFAPIKICAGTLGADRDILVSPEHRMLIEGADIELIFGVSKALVAAKDLVNDSTIRVETGMETVEYFHILFDQHEILQAHGTLSESFYPHDNAVGHFSNRQRNELFKIFPELEGATGTYSIAYPGLMAHEVALLSRQNR